MKHGKKNYKKRTLKRSIDKYNKAMDQARSAMNEMMKGGYVVSRGMGGYAPQPMYADGGIYKDYAMYSGSHINTMAPHFGFDGTKASNVASSIHGVDTGVQRLSYPKSKYGGNTYMSFGGTTMMTPRTPMMKKGGSTSELSQMGFNQFKGVSNGPRNPKNTWGGMPKFGGYYESLPVQADPYGMARALTYANVGKKQMGGSMYSNDVGMSYSLPDEMQQGGMMPAQVAQQAPQPDSQAMANQMIQQEQAQAGMAPQQEQQQQEGQQAQMQELQALAQAAMQGDEQAIEIIQQLPEDQQQIILQMMEEMEQSQPQPQMNTQQQKYGGKTKKKYGGSTKKRKTSKNKMNKLYRDLGIPC